MQKAIFIVGHSRGAAISNILGSKFENKDGFETFVYTFATPNTTTEDESIRKSYNTIFNIVNEDDLVPFLPLENWGFGRYGHTYSVSVKSKYEYRFGTSKDNSWEEMFGMDYNYNGHLSATKKSLEKLVTSRNKLYEYSDNPNTIYVYRNSYYNNGEEEVKKRIDKYGERISRYCQVTAISKGYYPVNGTFEPEREVFDIEVKQTPAFLMMVLADLAASKCHTRKNGHDEIVEYDVRCNDEDTYLGMVSTGFFVASEYDSAKNDFVHSAADTQKGWHNIIRYGGMVHAHMPGTYFFLANDYKNVLKATYD